jgi:signal transduction histidine kinase
MPNPNLLVVDDSPANLQLLGGMLRRHSFKVRLVPSGELALQTARHELPDLILLDINMPGMNGYEVCTRLKADEQFKAIPVIFISALDDTLDKVKAFSVGGVDYVTKPFQFDEVLARVRTHLALRYQEQQLEQACTRLQELERLRDSLVHMIVHDMRSPLMVVRMSLDLIKSTAPSEVKDLEQLIKSAEDATASLTEMTALLLDTSRMEAGQMPINKQRQDLTKTLRATMDSLALMADQRQVRLQAPEALMAQYDQDLVGRVVANLLTNAFKFTTATGGVTLSVGHQDGEIRVSIADTGQGIAPEYHQKIFEKFSQTEICNKRIGVGLGLAFCKLAVEAHGGKIGVESQLGQGSTFWFTLPPEATACADGAIVERAVSPLSGDGGVAAGQ